MFPRKPLFAVAAFSLATFALSAQQVTDAERIEWFQHDKFGMFIHWGPYSYLAGEWNGKSIPVGTEAEWRALCGAIGQPQLADDARFKTAELRKKNEAALDRIITSWTSERDRWDATRVLQAVGVAAFPSMSNKDLAEDPHFAKRGYLVQLDHPEVGKRIHAGIPWKMSETPCTVRTPAPLRGADTEDVLKSMLGFTLDRIEQLRKTEVLI